MKRKSVSLLGMCPLLVISRCNTIPQMVVSPKFTCWNLSPQDNDVRRWSQERWSGTLIKWICPLIEEAWEVSGLSPWGTFEPQCKGAIWTYTVHQIHQGPYPRPLGPKAEGTKLLMLISNSSMILCYRSLHQFRHGRLAKSMVSLANMASMSIHPPTTRLHPNYLEFVSVQNCHIPC